MNAADGPGAAPTTVQADPDVPHAAPRRPVVRVAVVTLLVVVLVAGAAVAPLVLRPSLDGEDGWTSATGTTESGEVLTSISTEARAWPWATLTGVGDVPGAQVVDVWVKDGPVDPLSSSLWWPVDGGHDQELVPARVSTGGLRYAILWRVTDCAALDLVHVATGHLTTVVGTSASSDLAPDAQPGRHLRLLVDDGVCGEEVYAGGLDDESP